MSANREHSGIFPAGGSWRAGQIVRRIRKRRASKALILMYHRVAELPCDPFGLGVTPHYFAEHLETLTRWGRPLSLSQLARAVRDGRVPKRAVVVTFDDGYADNLLHAKPLLERYDVPATLFISSGYVGHPRGFWVDHLVDLLLTPGRFPRMVTLAIGNDLYTWDLGESASYSHTAFQQHVDWRSGDDVMLTKRHSVFRSLYALIRPLPDAQIWSILGELEAQVVDSEADPSINRTLTPDEVRAVADGGLIEVGAHTLTHPRLSALDAEAQRREILGSKQALEELLGEPIRSFSYPYGRRDDYTDVSVDLVRDAGFSQACAVLSAPVVRGTDPFQLPRLGVDDRDGDAFERQLDRWIDI